MELTTIPLLVLLRYSAKTGFRRDGLSKPNNLGAPRGLIVRWNPPATMPGASPEKRVVYGWPAVPEFIHQGLAELAAIIEARLPVGAALVQGAVLRWVARAEDGQLIPDAERHEADDAQERHLH